MNELHFDRRTFNLKYALVFTILQFVLVAGFAAMVIAIVLGAFTDLHFTIPDAVLPFALGYLLASLVGFPVITIIKVGYRRSLSWSKLTIDNNVITYDRLAEKMWTAVGGVEEHHVFSINRIESAEFSLRYLLIRGQVHKEVINNNRLLEEKDICSVKIPRAYANMERIEINGQ